MNLHPIASACRSCRYYTPEGRRGGNCQQLGVPVRGGWQACSLAIPAFAPSGENLEKMLIWQKEVFMLREVLPLEDSSETAIMDAQEPKSAAIEEKQQEPLPV
ncbi:hypothetical protein [Microseira sp. BLCC-F43]|jgi:hypothetical protein|uniref:hypothetical protein n=1 Tax=Microseira sp. BLCC-F43 TaxID=3153602 RepID=UPI0035BAE083